MNQIGRLGELSTCLCILVITITHAQYCSWSARTVSFVNFCPSNEESTQRQIQVKQCVALSKRQNCTMPVKFKYHCLSSDIPGKLVEVCTTETEIAGVCLVYNIHQAKLQTYDNVTCSDVIPKCPNKYLSTKAHLYAPCHIFPNLTLYERNTTIVQSDSGWSTVKKILVGIGIGVTVIGFTVSIWRIVISKCKKARTEERRRGGDEESQPLQQIFRNTAVVKEDLETLEMAALRLPEVQDSELDDTNKDPEQVEIDKDPERVENRRDSTLSDRKSNRIKQCLGEYSTWKTPISDQFSPLSDDEVCVLFCFLCSDSGTPDFTDTDGLDILNHIRQKVYRKNSVTSKEAQRTLNRLKSRGFLWDQDGVDITEDVKDETMYRVIERYVREGYVSLYLVYRFFSYTTAVRYLRSRRYTRKSGEKCVIIDEPYDDTCLIRRLQMNILTHVTMKDTSICDNVSQILNIPIDKIRMSESERGTFLEKLQQTGDCVQYRGGSQGSVQHVEWLWRYKRPDIVRSCIVLHPHCDIYIINNTAYRKHSQYHDRLPAERCLLYCLLMVDDYTVKVKEESHIKVYNAIRERYFTELPVCEEITANNHEGIIHVENDVIKFESDDTRHDVMYAFLTECLMEDSDLKFFLTMASRDVISEYCRSWLYERSEGERCLYIPNEPDEFYGLFIDRLQLDILTHCTVSDEHIHYSISERLNIPKEVIKWDIDARRRYVKSSKEQGRKKMYCARGMLVGCTGAGKTTLLRKLQNTETADEDRPTETTVGLEVHEDLFEIEYGTLKNYKGNSSVFNSDKQLISMTDFAGQAAYYACHQVYLSRRAFYMLVVDMSKNLTEKAHEHNKDRHDPVGSLFHHWTYQQYFTFWLRCIKTYCDDGNTGKGSSPVILIASHQDEADSGKYTTPLAFYDELKKSLPEGEGNTLLGLLSPYNFLKVECSSKALNDPQRKLIEDVKKCIVKTVQSLPQWGEEIPLNWATFEEILGKRKDRGEKILKRGELKKIEELRLLTEGDMEDMLRFFQEIGHILYFADEKLKDTIIINVQWFVDAFKHIITDPKHLARDTSDKWLRTGRIHENAVREIWKETEDESYNEHGTEILQYMEKLGLMTEKLQGQETSGEMYYVPSMNRTDLSQEYLKMMEDGEKTSLLIFHFKTYLPHFFFFRLVVSCLGKWRALNQELFCKNAAFYREDDQSHSIAIAVNKTSIQLQVFKLDKKSHLSAKHVRGIREEVTKRVDELTETFHKQVRYEIGYSCKDVNITSEDDDLFLSEREVLQLDESSDEILCARHALKKPFHYINKPNLIRFWMIEN